MSNLDKNKIDYFKQIFLQRQQEIIASNHQEEIDNGGDEVDNVQANLLKSMLEKLSLRDKETLGKIKNAQQKIAEGTFGLCEECEEPIPEKRLIALPYATACVTCQEQLEKHIKQYQT